jgi:hypothetical protein
MSDLAEVGGARAALQSKKLGQPANRLVFVESVQIIILMLLSVCEKHCRVRKTCDGAI